MLKAKHALAVCGVLVAAATFTPAIAADTRGVRTVLTEGEAVHPPRGYTQMCERRPELCPARAVNEEMRVLLGHLAAGYGRGSLAVQAPALTDASFRQLQQVNRTVNRAIQPVEDRGADLWSFSAVAGDCEEYVMMKRELLAQLGWPRSALRIAVVTGAVDYEYHAVLVVSTQSGEFVLDNMVDHITTVEDSPYGFVVAQSARHPGVWVRVRRDV